jgi:hypothetical protein
MCHPEAGKRGSVKLGGIGMTSFGFDFYERDVPHPPKILPPIGASMSSPASKPSG